MYNTLSYESYIDTKVLLSSRQLNILYYKSINYNLNLLYTLNEINSKINKTNYIKFKLYTPKISITDVI